MLNSCRLAVINLCTKWSFPYHALLFQIVLYRLVAYAHTRLAGVTCRTVKPIDTMIVLVWMFKFWRQRHTTIIISDYRRATLRKPPPHSRIVGVLPSSQWRHGVYCTCDHPCVTIIQNTYESEEISAVSFGRDWKRDWHFVCIDSPRRENENMPVWNWLGGSHTDSP